MPNEVWAKLGVDTASVPADLNKAKAAFEQFGQHVQTSSAAHGGAAGDKLIGALEHRLTGSRHLAGVLATALGFNLEALAMSVTAALVGGTKEAWAEMGKLAEENAKLIERRMELAMTPKQIQDHRAKNRQRAEGDLQGAIGTAAEHGGIRGALEATIPGASKLGTLLGFINSEADDGVEIGKKQITVSEGELEKAQEVRAIKESHKKLDEHRHEMALKNLNSSEKIKAITDEIKRLSNEITVGKLDEIEVDQHRMRMIDLEAQKKEEILARAQREIDQKRELARLEGDLHEAQVKRTKELGELKNKLADRSKGTIDEIAGMKPKKSGPEESTHSWDVDTFGLDSAQAEAKTQATEIQRLKRQAEGLRTSGDVRGANAAFDDIGTKTQGLVSSGFAKSTEGGDMKGLKEAIEKGDTQIATILTAIQTLAGGKLKNQ